MKLDSRGTGLSTPINIQELISQYPSAQDQANYLKVCNLI